MTLLFSTVIKAQKDFQSMSVYLFDCLADMAAILETHPLVKTWDDESLFKNGPSWHVSVRCNKHICPCFELCFDLKDSSILLSKLLVDGEL